MIDKDKDKDNIDKEFEKILETRDSKVFAFWVLIVFFGGFLLWAAFVPLDEGFQPWAKLL